MGSNPILSANQRAAGPRLDDPVAAGGARVWLANAALAVCSIVLGYIAIEVIVFRVLLSQLPINLSSHLPDTVGVLVQNSKSHFVPRDYVAILGDSYAVGLGDWFLQARGDRTKPFHSANVIHEATGLDVVSFGKEGNASAEGLVSLPARIFAGSQCFIFPAIEPPRAMFHYYYEGNDAPIDAALVDIVGRRYGGTDDHAIDRYLVDNKASVPAWKCHAHLLDTMGRMAVFAYRHYIAGLTLTPDRRQENALVVGGKTIPAPPLQGPALDLDEQQIKTAMRTLARSLSWLRTRFSGVPTTIVYVPSPLAIYRHAGETVSFHYGRDPGRPATVALTERHSDLMCDLVRGAAIAQGAGFLDARAALRAAAAERIIHGPLDWFHFNEAGYRVLGQVIANRLRGDLSASECR